MKCIKCEKEMTKFSTESHDKFPDTMWHSGSGFQIATGFGSSLDGTVFHAVICDDCMIRLNKCKVIIFEKDYIYPETTKEEHEEFIEKAFDKLEIPDNFKTILQIYPNLEKEYKKTGTISLSSIIKQCPQVFKTEKELEDLLNNRE